MVLGYYDILAFAGCTVPSLHIGKLMQNISHTINGNMKIILALSDIYSSKSCGYILAFPNIIHLS